MTTDHHTEMELDGQTTHATEAAVGNNEERRGKAITRDRSVGGWITSRDIEEYFAVVGGIAGAVFLSIQFGFSGITIWGGLVGGGIVGLFLGPWIASILLKPWRGKVRRLTGPAAKKVRVAGEALGGALVGLFYSLPVVGLAALITSEDPKAISKDPEAIWVLGPLVIGALVGAAFGAR